MIFCGIDDLQTESDVEQKLVYPMLTTGFPSGLGYTASQVKTKVSLLQLTIDKGASKKNYFPDYAVVIDGLPVLIIEAKNPGEDLEAALREARLYAQELNARFPAGVNPCFRIVAVNGRRLISSKIDTSTPDHDLLFNDIFSGSSKFGDFVESAGIRKATKIASDTKKSIRPSAWVRALNLVGGAATRAEELPQNSFGATIATDYAQFFNPTNREQRALIARAAYVPSTARTRYIEPIDRIIRNAVSPVAGSLDAIKNSAKPDEILKRLTKNKDLSNQVLLLVGSGGSGKSTFVDYLGEVALSQEARNATVWARLDLNKAPVLKNLAYEWVATELGAQLRAAHPEEDFDTWSWQERLFRPEITKLRKGVLSLLDMNSEVARHEIVKTVTGLASNPLTLAKALCRTLIGDPNKLLVVVFDNCDKRGRDEQLLMFEVSQWLRDQFRCLVIMPIRDVTYEQYRNMPPLDTVLKGFVFRIEPPAFVDVLQRRVALALKVMGEEANDEGEDQSYTLPNGARVTYPASEQAYYLASILHSLFAYDRFVRQVMAGLAGRDVRRALELFLDFCISGHIGADEIFKIKVLKGHYVLPLPVVSRVILRMRRRYFDGNESYVKNLFQCETSDQYPDHFTRIAILQWLESRQRRQGPSGVEGFFRVQQMFDELQDHGYPRDVLLRETTYLLRARCVMTEHLESDLVDEGDLVCIASAGVVHLQLLVNPDYIEACAEDAWVSDPNLAGRIASSMTQAGVDGQFARATVARVSQEFSAYLSHRYEERPARPAEYLSEASVAYGDVRPALQSATTAATATVSRCLFVGNLPHGTTQDELASVFRAAGAEPFSIHIPKQPNNNDRPGFAFITFATREHSYQALSMAGKIRLGNRDLRIDEADDPDERARSERRGVKARSLPDVSERVCFRNLPYSTKEADLNAHLAKEGLIPKEIYLHLRDGRFSGMAFVEFSSREDATDAISQMDETEIGGRKVYVSPAEPRKRK